MQIIHTNNINYSQPIDIIDAYNLSYKEAVKWNNNAKLYFLTSVDDPENNNYTQGCDGKRRNWNIDYVVPGTNMHMLITIHDNSIYNIQHVESAVENNNIINMIDVKLNTPEALEASKKLYNIYPNREWATGYHYVLSKDDLQTIMTVVCRDEDNNFTKINFNAKSGKLHSALHKVNIEDVFSWVAMEKN